MVNELTTDRERGLVISRLVHAPRALVFQTFMDPACQARWWGRPMAGEFTEVIEPARLRFLLIKKDDSGHSELEVHYSLSFLDAQHGTRLTLKAEIQYCTAEIAWGMELILFGLQRSWEEGLIRLEAEFERNLIVY